MLESELAQVLLYFRQAIDGVQAPFYYVLNPANRLYWGFILSSIIMIVLYFIVQDIKQHKKISSKKIIRSLFSRAYWLNRSTATDVFYLFLNSVLRVVFLLPLIGSKLLATILVARIFQGNFGNSPDFEWSIGAIMLVYTLVFFIVEDFSRFLLHFTMHKIPFFWRFHKVHHSATVLTPLTVYRVHPVEMSLYFVRGTAVFGFVSGFFVYLFGSKLGGFEIVGVDALGFIFCALGANLRHSHIWLGFGVFERWFISPAQHQLHHSNRIEHRDKNFGTCLACWDRLFRSLVLSPKRRYFRFGLGSGVIAAAGTGAETEESNQPQARYHQKPLHVQGP